jgi:hypothetical protein
MMVRLVLLLAAGLAGCGKPATTSPTPAVPDVVASEASLAAAGKVVLACYALPACAAQAPKAQIKLAYDAAYSAVTQAQTAADAGGSPNMTAAAAAVASLAQIVAQLPKT